MLTQAQFLSAHAHKREWLPLPDLTPPGETHDPAKHGVYVGTMTVSERDTWEAALCGKTPAGKKISVRALTAIYTVQDQEGNRLLTPDNLAEVEQQPASVLSDVFEAALRINRVRKEDKEELTKN